MLTFTVINNLLTINRYNKQAGQLISITVPVRPQKVPSLIAHPFRF
jgi:hypothetical protein